MNNVKKNYDYIMFDLDGTISESLMGVGNSIIYAMKHFGVEIASPSELRKCVGPPLQYSFSTFFGLEDTQVEEAIRLYRVYYKDKGIYECELYPGIRECIQALHSAGKKLILATSKPEQFARAIIQNEGLADCFTYQAGAAMDGSRDKKADIIRYAVDTVGISDLSTTVMIGDRHHDIDGAKEHGIDAVGVMWGYGSREEFADAVYIADSAEDLKDYLL